MKPHILITGATHGIGRAIAQQFAEENWVVSGVARTESDLSLMSLQWKLAGYPVFNAIQADLTCTKDLSLIPAIAYDVIVLNAASYQEGTLLGQQDTYMELVNLNVFANHLLARRLVPKMIEQKKGHLIVIGSTGTDNWKNHMTAYLATKYALRGLYMGWDKELENTDVLTTLVSVGATLTRSWQNETPPPQILQPESVAREIMNCVDHAVTGRVIVSLQ